MKYYYANRVGYSFHRLIRLPAQRILLCETCGYRLKTKVKTMSDSQNRKRKKVIQVWLTEEEKADIEGNASDSGMSASRYLRTLGLGHVPPSKLDQKNIVELAKINGDQGRLGGLLKMWLTNEERQEAAISKQVRQLIELIEQSQLELLKSVRGLR